MGFTSCVCFISAALSLISHLLLLQVSAGNKKTYIVGMKSHEKPMLYNTHDEWYSDIVHSITKSSSILYTYSNSYHGFAAAMSPEEAQSLVQSNSSVVNVYEDKQYFLHTTRSPHFLGLEKPDLWPGHTLEDLDEASQNVIIGIFDSGVWPESESFHDDGMLEVPKRWNGTCDSNFKTYCNKKLIGAQTFLSGHKTGNKGESETPRDFTGHGTHTASTAAGSEVRNASLFGLAGGTARGVAHRSRLAAYKVCGGELCLWSDILAGMDAAIRDGVDVMSLSLGSPLETDYGYDIDFLAIGAFAAMERGIFVSCSAGNFGPGEGSVVNVAPWIMTVGAGTIDRDFRASVTLGNGEKYTGASLYTGKGIGIVKLVYGGGRNSSASKSCLTGSLDPTLVRGKVVLCDRGPNRTAKGAEVKDAGGIGMIIASTKDIGGEDRQGDTHVLPALSVGKDEGDKIRDYVSKTGNNKKATVELRFIGMDELNVKPSPMVTAFSSRGPNIVTPQILKPDVIAPGLNILAAWSGAVAPTSLPIDKRRTDFNIASGTSMSCPHVSGLAALLKAAHPDWSPSAIKSALMTTAYTLDNTNSTLGDSANINTVSTPWAYGAGHVDLHKALAPGLVYDATPQDYIAYLCSTNYTIEMIRDVTRNNSISCRATKFKDPGQLNYPSFSVVFGRATDVVKYTRELTNVEDAHSIYQVSVEAPPDVSVNVKPSQLVFGKAGDKQRYTATFKLNKGVARFQGFGSITWKNEKNRVTSPVSVTSTGF